MTIAYIPGYRENLKVTWFEDWHSALDDALESLPESEVCPKELYRILLQNKGSTARRIALVSDRSEVLSVIGLRRTTMSGSRCWEPLPTWITPGFVCPAKKGYLIKALNSLGINIRVAWWRMQSLPPNKSRIKELSFSPTYAMRCTDRFERYWRAAGHLNTVRRMRKRCKSFELTINSPGSAEWTIKNWAAKWRVKPFAELPDLSDRLIAANYMESRGRHYTLLLLDQKKPIAGHTFVVHGDDVVWQVTYREPDYDKYGVGTRLMDLSFFWAAESGFNKIDLGGHHDYKKRWAPEDGSGAEFTICPALLFFKHRIVRQVTKAVGRLWPPK